jgi:hypothetical protein
MSIRTLTALAVARDKARPGTPAGGGVGEAAVTQPDGTARGRVAGAPPEKGGTPQQFVDVLVTAIPTEPLAAYTALLALVVATLDGAPLPHDTRAYLPLRWWIYGAFLAVIVAAVWLGYYRATRGPSGLRPSNRRRIPLPELASALIAGASWGLVMPGGPLNAQLSDAAGGVGRALATGCIVIGAGAVLSFVQAPQLRGGSRTPGESTP